MKEILPLTSLRGIAALWVVTTHLSMGVLNEYLPTFSEKTDFGIFTLMIANGHYAVDFFFVLSGFIMCYVYQDKLISNFSKANIYNFYIARIARLWPVTSFFSILLFVPLIAGIWESERDINTLNFIASIFFLDLALGMDAAINQPAWSISAEFFAYLLFPLFLIFLKRDWKAVHLSALIVVLTFFYAYIDSLDSSLKIENSGFTLMRVSIGFFCGCLIYSISQKIQIERYANVGLVCFLALFLFCIIFFPLTAFIFPLIPWIILFLAYSDNAAAKFMSIKPMHYLGKISFSIYLAHYPFIELMEAVAGNYFESLNPQEDQNFIRIYLLLMIAGTTTIAAFSYHMIEMPFRNMIKNRLSR